MLHHVAPCCRRGFERLRQFVGGIVPRLEVATNRGDLGCVQRRPLLPEHPLIRGDSGIVCRAKIDKAPLQFRHFTG